MRLRRFLATTNSFLFHAKSWSILGTALVASLGLTLVSCDRGGVTEIASGFQLLPFARTALADNGLVLAAEAGRLVFGSGAGTNTIDLAAGGWEIKAPTLERPIRVRTAGDIAFVANRNGALGCVGTMRGAYHVASGGGSIDTLFENCPTSTSDGAVGPDVGLSPNGTVAFSQIRNGGGAIYRGPVSGPVSVLESGSGTFYNTWSLDVSDNGRVAVEMEYFDGIAGGLMRGVLAFDSPQQPKANVQTAIEKMGIGSQPPVAVNASGHVAFTLAASVTITIGGSSTTYDPGVYVATPTLFNTPKTITKIADLTGAYCRFGGVDINDAGTVAFEAALDGEMGCNSPSSGASGPVFDGIFTGPSSTADAVVVRGQSRLGGHQYFDSIYLGEINNASQVSFTTTYSEPLVDPVKVWRWDP